MKKIVYCIFTVLLAAVLGISSMAVESSEENEFDWINYIASMDYEWNEIDIGGGKTGYQIAPIYIGDYQIISSKVDGAISTLIHNLETDERVYYNYLETDIVNQTISENVIEKRIDTQAYIQELTERKEMAEMAFLEDNIIGTYSLQEFYVNEETQEPDQREESYWGMSYYMNYNSAYKDRYWRLNNPEFEEPDYVSINFFSYVGETIHNYAMEFASVVDAMYVLEERLDVEAGMGIPEILKALASQEPTLSDIASTLIDV